MPKTNNTIESAVENGTFDPWGVNKTYHYRGYEFTVYQHDITAYVSPQTFVVAPIGYIDALPKMKGFRRNTVRQWYTTKDKDHDDVMERFLTEFQTIVHTSGNTLYHNKPIKDDVL